MIGAHSHLHEERLFDCYLAARAGDALDPPVADHLTDCADCAARYAELTTFMNDLRDDGVDEVDEIFTAERLQHQQRQIERRLALVGRSARVIHFPQPAAAPRQMPHPARHGLPRWVAATAAAGLVAGMVTGMFLERAGHRSTVIEEVTQVSRAGRPGALRKLPPLVPATAAPAVPAPVAVAPAVAPDPQIESERNERFMSEIEQAADRPRTAELTAYDELTPHVREVTYAVAGR